MRDEIGGINLAVVGGQRREERERRQHQIELPPAPRDRARIGGEQAFHPLGRKAQQAGGHSA